MNHQAIETRYAGCHFRSRLEARWAVFFDHLGIRWEYEPQGFDCYWRLALEDATFPYLPDFWLPDKNMWVEVKGALTNDECVRLLNAAAHLCRSCDGGGGVGMLVLGPVPNPEWDVAPTALHFHKGDLLGYAWTGQPAECAGYGRGIPFARDVGGREGSVHEVGLDVQDVTMALLGGSSYLERAGLLGEARTYLGRPWDKTQQRRMPPRWKAAIAAARSARFEHGQSGAT